LRSTEIPDPPAGDPQLEGVDVLRKAWSQYWSNGNFESLPGDRAAGRLVALDTAWRDFFSGLPSEARLLDLATGGGDVIRRAIAVRPDFRITGVDFADLTAVNATFQIPGIELVGNTDVSNLPFADASFDGITSQFGIEYAEMLGATQEAVRVLAPRGCGCFVLHHVDSPITQGVAKSLAAYRAVFADSSAFKSGRKVFELYQDRAPRDAVTVAEAEFRDAAAILETRLRTAILKSGLHERAFGAARDVVALLAILARAPGSHAAANALRRIETAERHIQASALRKEEQVNAALDSKEIDKLVEGLKAAGAAVDAPHVLKYPLGKVMAWCIRFRK
jgi:ubiquinone/menaquinone biosynthesis C-methylase UbiE